MIFKIEDLELETKMKEKIIMYSHFLNRPEENPSNKNIFFSENFSFINRVAETWRKQRTILYYLKTKWDETCIINNNRQPTGSLKKERILISSLFQSFAVYILP